MAEALPNHINQFIEIDVFPVHFIDDKGNRFPVFFRQAPDLLGADLDTGGSRNQQQYIFYHPQTADYISEKVAESGCINNIDFVLIPFGVKQGSAD